MFICLCSTNTYKCKYKYNYYSLKIKENNIFKLYNLFLNLVN